MLLRKTLLFLSRQDWMRRLVERAPFSRRAVKRFVAGESLDDVIPVLGRLRAEGIQATLDRLGEHITRIEEAVQSRDAYIEALHRIRDAGFQATISLKLTQLGLDLNESQCRRHLTAVVEAARAGGLRVEVDMESSRYTDQTLRIARDLHRLYGNVRAVIQAYLYRSEGDIITLCRESIPVRLCKGAYLEPPDLAYPKKKDVDENYRRLMLNLLGNGLDPAIATHDTAMIRAALQYAAERRIRADHFEFQMLYGVHRDLQRMLVKKGARLRLYVPYGRAWYPYFMRRLAERPANVLFLMRNLFRS